MSTGNVKRISDGNVLPKPEASVHVRREGLRIFSRILLRALLYLVLISVGFTMILPLLWMLSTSLKEPGVIFILPPQWIPNPPQWDNYVKLFQVLPFGRFLFNSIKIASIATFGALLTSSMAAFAFAVCAFRVAISSLPSCWLP